MKKIGSIIPPIINELGIGGSVKVEALSREWHDIFGEPLSLHTWPSGLENHTLTITVDSPVWLQQLSFLKNEIISKLNTRDISDLRFRLGRVPQKPAAAKASHITETSQPELDEKTISFVEETVSSLSDREMQEFIKRAMRKSLARKKKQ